MSPMTYTLFDPPPPKAIPAPPTPPAETEPTSPQPSPYELIQQGIIPTRIAPWVAKAVTISFIAAILLVPLAQVAYEILRPRTVMLSDGREIQTRTPQVVDILRQIPTAENLHAYERALEDNSIFKSRIKPRLQYLTLRTGGFASNDVVIPLKRFKPTGWLFYQLGNDYLMGPGFLDQDFLSVRTKALAEDEDLQSVNADPRKAIIQFHKDCQAAGVHLVYVPIPVKAMIQPGQLTERLHVTRKTPVPNNPSYQQFLADLRAAGVDVFDPTPPYLMASDDPRFLEQDTHWTPQWMEQVAEQLAAHVKTRVNLPATSKPLAVRVEPREMEEFGDIYRTLMLPGSQALFTPESFTINRVLDASTGQPIAFSQDADVLLLGDSFSNIYSNHEQRRMGDSAGFPYHIARHLGRPLDVLVEDGSAATALREALAARPHPFRGKRVIIWEVAMHELTAANWKIVPIKN